MTKLRASSALRRRAGRRRDVEKYRAAQIRRISKLERKPEAFVVNALLDYSIERIDRRRFGRALPAEITFES